MTMGFTNAEQVYELFLSGGMGFLLGVYYDVFRIVRRLLRPSKITVFFQDCFFFSTAAVLVFLFSLSMTDGIVRWYVLFGVFCGFMSYRYTVGRGLMRCILTVCRISSRVYRALQRLVFHPVLCFLGFLYHCIEKPCKKTRKIFKKLLKPIDKILYNHTV